MCRVVRIDASRYIKLWLKILGIYLSIHKLIPRAEEEDPMSFCTMEMSCTSSAFVSWWRVLRNRASNGRERSRKSKRIILNWTQEPMGHRQDIAGKACLVSKTYWWNQGAVGAGLDPTSTIRLHPVTCGISYSWCSWIYEALIRVGLALVSPVHVGQGGGKLHTAPGKVSAVGNWGGSMEEVEFAVPHGQKWSRPEGMGMQSRSWHLKKEVVTGRFAGNRCGRRRRVQGRGGWCGWFRCKKKMAGDSVVGTGPLLKVSSQMAVDFLFFFHC